MCALTSDLEILEDGDESEIGERGVSVSKFRRRSVILLGFRSIYLVVRRLEVGYYRPNEMAISDGTL